MHAVWISVAGPMLPKTTVLIVFTAATGHIIAEAAALVSALLLSTVRLAIVALPASPALDTKTPPKLEPAVAVVGVPFESTSKFVSAKSDRSKLIPPDLLSRMRTSSIVTVHFADTEMPM